MKNRESFIKLLLLAVIGAMIGVSGNILLRFSGEGIEGIYAEMGAALRHTGWKIESLLILVVMAVRRICAVSSLNAGRRQGLSLPIQPLDFLSFSDVWPFRETWRISPRKTALNICCSLQ